MKAAVERVYRRQARERQPSGHGSATGPVGEQIERGEHWWFVGRRRILQRLLDSWLELPAAARLLDLGPGYGVNTGILAPRGRLAALDLDADSLRACADAGAHDLLLADAARLPLAARSQDLVTAFDVLEHLDDDLTALREWRRVLRPEGRLLITVPAMHLLWGRQDLLAEHRRRYCRRQLAALLDEAGFQVLRLSYFNTFLFLPILAVRLLMRPFARWQTSRSDLDVPAPFGLDRLFAALLASEAAVLSRRNLPVGVSLVCLARPVQSPSS